MGKGKRLKSQKRITMGRGEFKAYMFNIIDHSDQESYERLCELFLMATGVVDKDGNLTEEYAESPYWKVENGVLKPSEHANLLAEIAKRASNG